MLRSRGEAANTLYEELFWVDVIKKKGSISFSAANAIEDLWWQTVWKSTGASGAPDFIKSFLGDDAVVLATDAVKF